MYTTTRKFDTNFMHIFCRLKIELKVINKSYKKILCLFFSCKIIQINILNLKTILNYTKYI